MTTFKLPRKKGEGRPVTLIPDYHDTLSTANLQRGQLPFYVLDFTFNSVVPLHHHDFAELFYVCEGSGTEVINGKKHNINPGSVSFLLPHHLHEIHSSRDNPIRMYCCMFDINVLYGSRFDFELAGRLLQTGSALPSYVDFEPAQARQLHHIFETIYEEYNSGGFGKSSFIRSKLLEALLLFTRSQAPQPDPVNASAATKKTFWDILQYVHLHYADKLTLESLSQQYKVSAPFISHSFKRLSGQGFLEYLHTLRISSALSLLVSTEMAVTDIALEVGFDSYRNFARVFKKMKSMTPGEYREKALSAEHVPNKL
ncbi:AraC family transcriptional regulator [Paenibacillaceae bacterium WGS1546]|uniref:AraC family transcriptional regulator n=1 Tax=Cohnella sp. WGS1546 TaxID=3366810 RepID=UPI00372D0F95